MTMLTVTHEIRLAEAISDLDVTFDAECVVEHRPPHEILASPREERTRRFLRAVLER